MNKRLAPTLVCAGLVVGGCTGMHPYYNSNPGYRNYGDYSNSSSPSSYYGGNTYQQTQIENLQNQQYNDRLGALNLRLQQQQTALQAQIRSQRMEEMEKLNRRNADAAERAALEERWRRALAEQEARLRQAHNQEELQLRQEQARLEKELQQQRQTLETATPAAPQPLAQPAIPQHPQPYEKPRMPPQYPVGVKPPPPHSLPVRPTPVPVRQGLGGLGRDDLFKDPPTPARRKSPPQPRALPARPTETPTSARQEPPPPRQAPESVHAPQPDQGHKPATPASSKPHRRRSERSEE